jgi:3-oxoacyl-[acyl-carrier protein] reductase
MNIIITGASKGIGFQIARTIALTNEETHAIGICSRNADELANAESELKKNSSKHQFFSKVCDVSSENDVAEFVLLFEEKFGAVDALVNNAGFGIFKPILELSKQEFESVIATNTRGPFLFTKAVLPAMRSKKSGTIVTISSLAGKSGFKSGAAYCASKFAVRGMMQCLFLEVRSDNIRFVTINPGSVDTEFYSMHNSGLKSMKTLTPQDVADCVEMVLLLPQNADISDIDVRPTNPKG